MGLYESDRWWVPLPRVIAARRSARNCEFVRGLLRLREPRFAAQLNAAVSVVMADTQDPARVP